MVLSLRPSAFAFGSGFLDFLFRHEVGHFAGLGHSPGNCMGDSVMVGADPRYDYGYATGVTGADNCAISSLYQYIPPDPNMCDGYGTGCSPVIIAFSGELRLTPPSVWFDLAATGFPQHVSWIDVAADAGFLVLDRSLNGVIDDGRELFGNITPLSWGLDGESTTDGFTALAWFDQAANGGNGDGWLGPDDMVFALLRIWTDSNHNGSSEPGELHLLDSLGIVRIFLDAREAGRRDRYGNAFRYRAKVQVLNPQGRQVDRFAYDVFLVIGR